MVYMLNGTPRAVEASLTVPGPPRGSQSTYDRALRAVFGADDSALQGDVKFVEVPDELALQPGAKPWELAVVALRRMLHAHRKEQVCVWGGGCGAQRRVEGRLEGFVQQPSRS
jgi:hypothetical protein